MLGGSQHRSEWEQVVFDPARIPEEQCVEGHLDSEPVYDVLLRVHTARVSGRLTTDDASGANHLFFMQGRPVGVTLAEPAHPLGQLLLELGRLDGHTFVKLQRHLVGGNRLAGQVYKDHGVLDDAGLQEVLTAQARKKVEHFCRLGSRPFTFCRGMTFLTGFTSTPLDLFAVVYLAVRAQLRSAARVAWLNQARGMQVRIINAAGDANGLPAPLVAYGFGAPEERFLQRIVGGWEKVEDLVENGTLPADEAAVLLRYLEVIGRLERRSPPQVPAHISELLRRGHSAGRQAAPDAEDVFSSSPASSRVGVARTPLPASASASTASRHDEVTDPRGRSIHEEHTQPVGPAESSQPRPRPPPLPLRRPPVPTLLPPPSAPVDEGAITVTRSKKPRRTEPLPSEATGLKVSETRREKTAVSPIPTIVIDDE
jgi:hypothetical protein